MLMESCQRADKTMACDRGKGGWRLESSVQHTDVQSVKRGNEAKVCVGRRGGGGASGCHLDRATGLVKSGSGNQRQQLPTVTAYRYLLCQVKPNSLY